jgi:carboxylate-amine ligase
MAIGANDMDTAVHADWAKWGGGPRPYTVGIEEEVMLLDPQRNWALAQRIDDVLEALPDSLVGYIGAETHQAAIELATDPHASVADAVAQLRTLRGQLAGALDRIGLVAGVAGTHPSAVWSETKVTSASRYRLILQTMHDLAMREPTFALHVHVGVPDPDQAIELYNRLRVHLPLLLALSGNSPFWRGRYSGFASSRTILFQAFPRTGMPRRYGSYDEWVETVDLQIRSRALPESTFLWWDVRPQPRFGTVEVRIMDAQSRVGDVAALVALVQSIARLELEEGYATDDGIRAEEALAENRFIAARDGMEARLIDTSEESLRPVTRLLAELVDAAHPHAEALGCATELARVQALAAYPGAARQRTYPSDEDGLIRLVAGLADGFARS